MSLSSMLFRTARVFYRATPIQAVRLMYYRAFSWLVRHRVVQRQVDGATLDLDLGETIDLTLFLGEFEKDVRAAIAEHCKPGMTVIDIGANVGAHALLFARLVAPNGRVVAFEPTEYAFRKLERNVALNPSFNVTTVHTALAEEAGPAQTVNFRSSWPTFGPRRDGPSIVAFERLDGWWNRNAPGRVDLIKLDVDGNEYGVLAGAEDILRNSHPVVLMEVVGPHLDDEARNPLHILERHGYSFRDVRTGKATSIAAMRDRLPRNDTGLTVSLNIIAEAAPS
ncbi:MAG TPA: FkbM family methyltransferase [Thermoanaerobaculia bacterium]|nr:FkbM family methyltransferase [Thermoanaerobaculia bacterium]